MLHRIIQYLGVTLIVTFCAWSVHLCYTIRLDDPFSQETDYSKIYAIFFEEKFFDFRMKFTLPSRGEKIDDRIILAAIDDNSLSQIGRWPWSRTKIAELIDKLKIYGAKTVAFDVFFSEPERFCRYDNSPDDVLKNAIINFQKDSNRRIILSYSTMAKIAVEENSSEYLHELPDSLYLNTITDHSNPGQSLQEFVIEKRVYPIKELLDTEAPLGHISSYSDHDGVYRHYNLINNVQNIYLPSFGLQTYINYVESNVNLEVPNIHEAYLHVNNYKFYINQNGETKIRWFGNETTFPMVDVYRILTSKNDDSELHKIFKNKIVFVGSTAYGAHDFRNSPVNDKLPGVLYHMNVVNMLLDGKFFVNHNYSNLASWIMLASGTIIMISVMILNNALIDFAVVNGLLIIMFVIDTYYFVPRGYNNKLFFSMLSVLMCYSWSTLINFYITNQEKQKIKGTFSRYLAPSIVNDLLKNPQKLRLGGEKKVITVFFSDVRDFTTISEKLTPEQLSQALNMYMTMMTDTLFEHYGTLDKYIGDAMVACWGAPVDLPDNAYWAVKGAIQMIEKLPAINAEFERLNFPLFKHGIGLNTGECSVGNMGSNQIFSYTALGDNMNLGARLESLCKFYGVQLNVSEFTLKAIPEEKRREFIFRTLDKVRVKGKEKAVTIYEIMHPSHPLYTKTSELTSYEEGFQYYIEGKFAEASAIFKTLLDQFPEDPTFIRMFTTAEDFMKSPPPAGWDGTFTHKSK